MEHAYPDYQFPRDVAVSIQDGQRMSAVLLEDANRLAKKSGFPVALESIFTSCSANKRGLIRHFRRESIHSDPIVIIRESGYRAARAVLAQTIAADACAWVLAQRMKILTPDELRSIDSDYTDMYGAKEGPRLVKFYKKAMAHYTDNYAGDKKIHALFRFPGMLAANEDPNLCVQALSTICSPGQNPLI